MKAKKKNKEDWKDVMTPFGPARKKKTSGPTFTCSACGNTKSFKIYSSGTMELLCDCSGGTIITISEEFNDGGSIDKVVCAQCGQEV